MATEAHVMGDFSVSVDVTATREDKQKPKQVNTEFPFTNKKAHIH